MVALARASVLRSATLQTTAARASVKRVAPRAAPVTRSVASQSALFGARVAARGLNQTVSRRSSALQCTMSGTGS